jgi:hypothetical protein
MWQGSHLSNCCFNGTSVLTPGAGTTGKKHDIEAGPGHQQVRITRVVFVPVEETLMSLRMVVVAGFLLLSSLTGQGQEAACDSGAGLQPSAVARAWWEAFAVGNAEVLAERVRGRCVLCRE